MYEGRVAIGRDLEICALSAIMRGLVPVSVIKEEELSREGTYLWKALKQLSKDHKPPFAPKSVFAYAVSVLGSDRDNLSPYMGQVVRAGSGMEATTLVEMIRAKSALVAAVNLASQQLSDGEPDIGMLVAKLRSYVPKAELRSVTSYLNNGKMSLPTMYPLASFSRITKATGGVGGLWVVAGDTGVGKSTWVAQVAVDMAEHIPVLCWDMELGIATIINRLKQGFGDKIKQTKRAFDRLYIRESIQTLESDLIAVPAPAFIIIDPFQALPTRTDFRRTSLDQWIDRFLGLKRLGYHVLLISEKGRMEYNKARLSGFKDTGNLEFRADVAAHLLGDISAREETDYSGPIDFIVVKNRHAPKRGYICTLERVRGWRFKEVYNES